jgi:hypothetical protein
MRPLAPGRPGVAGPSSHAAAASASARIIRGRALVVSSHGSGGQPASALRLPRAGGTVGERRAVAGPGLAPAPGTMMRLDAAAPPRRAAPTRAPVPVSARLRSFGRFPGASPRNAPADTSGPMRPRPDPDRGRALPPPALTARSALAPIANRMAERGRLYPGLRSSRADRPGTSSPSGGPATLTVVQALATRRCDPERPVSPAPITLRRATHAQTDRPAPPPARAASAPPPPVRVDIDRLSDEVIRRIERRSRIERERRGLL